MLGRIVELSTRRPWAVLAVLALGIAAGLWQTSQLRLDALPDITGNQVVVLTRAPGLGPLEVEQQITRVVELATGSVPGLKRQRSLSRYGISAVTLIFEEGFGQESARQFVQERLSGLGGALPAAASPPELGPLTGGLGEIYQFTLSSEERSLAELLETAKYDLAPLLGRVDGVVEVNTWGGEVRTLDAVVDPTKLARWGLTLGEVAGTLADLVQIAPGAAVRTDSGGQAYLRGIIWPTSPEQLEALVIAPGLGTDRAPVRLGDVARARFGHEIRLGAATRDGEGEVVYVILQMLRGANALEVTSRIEEVMETVRALLPEDVELTVTYDRSELVLATVRTVVENLVSGGLLVIAVLFLLLGSFRAGLVTALVIPLSMLGALSGLTLLGVAGNLMSLGAVDFGLLVDGAVVKVESFFEEEGEEGSCWRERIRLRARDVAGPVTTSVLIILLVYAPILLLRGVDGRLFRPMAVTVVLALFTAVVLALTFVPAISVVFLRPKDVPEREPWLARAFRRAYRPVLDIVLGRPFIGLVAGAGLLALGILLLLRADTAFVPQLDEGDLVIQTTRRSDMSIEGAVAGATRIERIVSAVPEVEAVASRIGSPAVATDTMGLEQADIFVDLRPKDEWRPGMTKPGLIELLDERIRELDPEADPVFTQPIQMRFNELLGGDIADVSVSVYGEDLEVLRELAEEVEAAMKTIEGAADVRITSPPEVPRIDVSPDPVIAGQLGLTGVEILHTVTALEKGLEAARVYDGRVSVPVRLRLDAPASQVDLPMTPVVAPGGRIIPLQRVADIEEETSPSQIAHRGARRRVIVGFNVRGQSLGAVVSEGQARLRDLRLPPGYRIEWGGQYESLEQAQAQLSVVGPIALGLIFLMLLALFRDLRLVLLVLTNVPVAAVGGLLALHLRGLPLSISAGVGFIALSGIAVLNGVVLLSRVQHLEKADAGRPERIAHRAAENRLRPVLMTALTDAIGFLPMMLATGIGAEVQRPLATVVVGGLATSTLLTLFILPSVYVLLERLRERLGRDSSRHEA